MEKICLLDNKTINKIAAGEVVESPKSVVKELVENAIDAGAGSVTIEIKEGGISFIRVTDNGRGIPKDEVKTAFLRHATSKLSQIEDLESIFTLGFRGEALASIAAVAQVEMLTKTAEEETGTRILISGGELETMEDAACREGTSITVKNLFYNVPARRKFLKKPATESGYISDLVNKLALGHPEVSLCYINNGATVLHTAGNNDPKASVFYVYGKEAAGSMLPLSFQRGDYALNGLIGKPELCRANRNYENLFINGRFIKNSVVATAVEDAYKTKLLIGKFPVFVLNLEVSPALVDVNVHPAKLEVRFKSDDEVYDFFYTAVTKTLQETILIPQGALEKKREKKAEKETEPQQQMLAEPPIKETEISREISEKEAIFQPSSPKEPSFREDAPQKKEERAELPSAVPLRESIPLSGGKSVEQLLKRKPAETALRQTPQPYVVEKEEKREEQPQAFFRNYRIVGQIFRTYWLVEQEESLYLIDQHAAHERILYEELMGRFQQENVVSQQLLMPVMLNLTPSEKVTLQENRELLEGFGFGLERLGEDFALRAVPHLLREPDSLGFFTEILDRLAEERIRSVYDTKILAVATMACKAAVKGHDALSLQEAEALIGRLLKLENPFTCPHGRPTVVQLTRYELEKMFKRIQN